MVFQRQLWVAALLQWHTPSATVDETLQILQTCVGFCLFCVMFVKVFPSLIFTHKE